MLKFEEALQIVLKQDLRLGTERVALMDSPGRILAEDIFSDVDMPPFDKSAVDGFACKMDDIFTGTPLMASLRIIETIPAGYEPRRPIGPGHCSKIMTGAMIPEGADCVVMVEDTLQVGEDRIEITIKKTARNICFKAEDVRVGDKVLEKGTRIKPAHIAIMASVGCVDPLVSVLPVISVISTGDELVEPGQTPARSKIRNSNAYQLMAQAWEVPAKYIYQGIALDTPESLRDILEKAFDATDVVILTGGVSMGDFDYVPAIMKEMGVDILFKSVAIQPGRPTVFGRKDNRFVFGLPGNPVSSFVLFELMVKPFLRKLMGNTDEPLILKLPMGIRYGRKKPSRKSLLPVFIRDGKIFPVEYHGSAHILAYAKTDGLIEIEIGRTEIGEGEIVNVRPV
jgi:molybdopterin molybdotransferase